MAARRASIGFMHLMYEVRSCSLDCITCHSHVQFIWRTMSTAPQVLLPEGRTRGETEEARPLSLANITLKSMQPTSRKKTAAATNGVCASQSKSMHQFIFFVEFGRIAGGILVAVDAVGQAEISPSLKRSHNKPRCCPNGLAA